MKLKLIKFDNTKYWTESIKDELKDGKIYDVYIYNPEIHVHCCELTPSYELYFVDFSIECDESLPDDFYELVNECRDDSVIYIPVKNYKNVIDIDLDCETIDEVIDKIRSNSGRYYD